MFVNFSKFRVRDLVTFRFHGHCRRRFFKKIETFAIHKRQLHKRFLTNAAWSNFKSMFPLFCMLLLCFPPHGSICKRRVRLSGMTQIENAVKKDQKNFKFVYFCDCLMSLSHAECSCDRQFVYFSKLFLFSLITTTTGTLVEHRWLDLWEFRRTRSFARRQGDEFIFN